MSAELPVTGKSSITSNYGWRKHPINGKRKLHTGVDLISNKLDIIAPENGRILEVKKSTAPDGGYGWFVKILGESKFTHLFAHLKEDSITVKPGDQVLKGTRFATMGTSGASTGVHLHWEVRWQGIKFTDPIKWLQKVNK